MNVDKSLKISQAVHDLLALLDSPEAAAQAMSEMANAFNASQAELSAAWQDRGAGKCWGAAASRLGLIAAIFLQ